MILRWSIALAFSVSFELESGAFSLNDHAFQDYRFGRSLKCFTVMSVCHGVCRARVPECCCICSRSIFGEFHWHEHDVVTTLWIWTVDGYAFDGLLPINACHWLGTATASTWLVWPDQQCLRTTKSLHCMFNCVPRTSANALCSLFNAILTFLAVFPLSPSLSRFAVHRSHCTVTASPSNPLTRVHNMHSIPFECRKNRIINMRQGIRSFDRVGTATIHNVYSSPSREPEQ